MAELAVVPVVKFSLKFVWDLISNRASKGLEHGDLTDEKLRQNLLSEFEKLRQELTALRRKELVAAVAFMEGGYKLLKKNLVVEAKKEFNKARDAAHMAFGVVKDLQDKILATKIMVASALHEFEDKPETAGCFCENYISQLNSLPEVEKACQVLLGQTFGSKLRAIAGSSNRQQSVGSVSEVNRCVWQFFQQHIDDKWKKEGWPLIQVGNNHKINLITSFILLRCRAGSDFTYLSPNVKFPVCMVTANNKLFFVEAKTQGQADALLAYSLKVLDLENGALVSLPGHADLIISITKLSGDAHVVTGSVDKQIIVWDTHIYTLKCQKILLGHTGSITAVVANNTHIFSGSEDSLIKVWTRDTYELAHTLDGHGPISTLAVSNRHLFSYVVGEKIKYWDLEKWECLHDISRHGYAHIDNMFITSSSLVLHCFNGLHIINLRNLKESGRLQRKWPFRAILVEETVCCEMGNVLKSWDVSLLKCTGAKNLNQVLKYSFITCMCYDEVSGRLYLACTSFANFESVIVTL